MTIILKADLGDLNDVDVLTKPPVENNVLTYDSGTATWIPKSHSTAEPAAAASPYVIELSRWGIRNDGTSPFSTTKGINDALTWAEASGYNHVVLPGGRYGLIIDSTSFSCIVLKSQMHFEMAQDCTLQLEGNSSPWYRMFEVKGVQHAKISGGKLIGDKQTHRFELGVKFVRGGVNSDGSLNDNPNFIRSEVIDRYEHPGLLKMFRLWEIKGISAQRYNFFQYKDTVSSTTLAGVRTNGQFAPAAPTGRGWFGPIEEVNKMIFTIDITSSPLSDAQISEINAKVDSQNYTHEWGHGIEVLGSNHIEIVNVEISNCTGDAITTGWLEYKPNPNDYRQEDMGSYIYIERCDLHHCRRQGISLTGSNDTYVRHNKIHHIGRAEDGVTEDGTAPMFGIDIESMWSESNIPAWRPELSQEGLEVNTRIHIAYNYLFENERGHFVNADGIHVVLENNTFEGYNVGGVSSYQNNWYVKYLNNTLIGCELTVKGDNYVQGVICNQGNIKLQDVRGAFIQNCHIKNGLFYGSSVYGYFGTPSVDVAAGKFTLPSPHGMGNGAKVSFEEWVGKVPQGISVDKLYYTVNTTSTSFQVSETQGGPPVSVQDAGLSGFNVSRYDYGRCYISNVTLERDWRDDNELAPNFSVMLTGGSVKNVTVKNYDVSIRPPSHYAGRPIIVEGLTLIEGAAHLEGCHLSDSKFMRIKSSRMGGDITLGSNHASFTRKIHAENCLFQHVGINMDGHVASHRSTFLDCTIRKVDNTAAAAIANGYLENTKLSLKWLTKEKAMTVVRCIFKNVDADTNASTVFVENVVI